MLFLKGLSVLWGMAGSVPPDPTKGQVKQDSCWAGSHTTLLRDWRRCARAARASEYTGREQRTPWRVCGGSSGHSRGWGNTKCTSKPRTTASRFSHRGSRPPLLGTCPSLQGQRTVLISQCGGPHGKTSYTEQQQIGRRWNVRRSYVFSNSTE